MKQEPQNHEIRFKCGKSDKELIQRKADELSMTIKNYLLHLGKNAKILLTIQN